MLEQMIAYFDTIPSSHRALILAGGITFFWIIEGVIPMFKNDYGKWKHAKLNFILTLTTIIINFILGPRIIPYSNLIDSAIKKIYR